MSIAGNAIGFIRQYFVRNQLNPQPEIIQTMAWQSQYPGYAGNQQGGVGPLAAENQLMVNSLNLNVDLMSRYADFQDMAFYPECFTALSIYADESTQISPLKKHAVWFDTDNEQLLNILENTFYKRIRIDDKIWGLARTISKYGNAFYETVVQDGYGVVKLLSHRTQQMRRIQDEAGVLYGFIKDPTMAFKIDTATFSQRLLGIHDERVRDGISVFEPWEITHFRLEADDGDELYGVSCLEAARYAWKRLQMMEDALLVTKLTKGPQRYVYYVDVGDVPPNEARKILNQVKQDFKKQKLVQDGRVNFKYNALSQEEDLFIARRKDKRSTEVEVLSGIDSQSVADTEYFRNKLVAGLGVPKSYLGFDETIGRANLGQADLRLSRSILRIQRAMKTGIRQIADVDLASRNIDPDSIEFEVCMNVPSGVLEVSLIEVEKAKCELGSMYQGLEIPNEYIWKEILGFTDEQIDNIKMMAGVQSQEGEKDSGLLSVSSGTAAQIGGEPEPPIGANPGETPEPETPAETPPEAKTGTPGNIEASKYRKIDRSKQIMESRHREIIGNIISRDANMSRRINELKSFVQEIQSAMPKKRR